MKKALVVLVILVALGGAAFFAGWTALSLPLGTVGVLRSKSHGVDSRIVQSGEFRWVWYKLLPTNSEIIPFTLTPEKGGFTYGGELPQAETYKRFAGKTADFSWELRCDYSFTFNAESLPALVRDRGLKDNSGLSEIAAEIARAIENRAREAPFDADFLKTGRDSALERAILAQFPEIDNLSINLTAVKTPDFALYESGKALYEEFLAGQEARLAEEARTQASRNVTNQFRYDELEHLGELFSRYPSLIEYMKLENQ